MAPGKQNNDNTAATDAIDFLPDLCSVQSVLGLIIVSELLVMALIVSAGSLTGFDWTQFGMTSMLVLWIVLSSAGSLCRLRRILIVVPPIVAGILSYMLTLLITLFFSVLYFKYIDERPLRFDAVLGNLLVAAVISGVALRYLYLQQQLRNQQKAEMMARIQALQSRIRPHFLFNSMNSIASLIGIDPPAAERMVIDLSRLFRASLKQAGLTALSEEIALCESYIDIEQIRMGERLRVEWHYLHNDQATNRDDEALRHASVPSFLIQPLVENAIYHGIQPIPEGGTIAISIAINNNRVAVSIRNPVLSREQFTHHRHIADNNGMALENIRHRLVAYYENRAELKVENLPGEFAVHLRFPAKPRH
ncbi:two-component system sensor histidine kinase AlgZ [Alteromonadaceae bacterium 2753L.S.0a.02]|nr:two-component system sensor histidine kinase AlgZ [Alteromonadaceae bacterium 2753L.S.0a.02]